MTGDRDTAAPSYEAALALHMQGHAGEAERAYRAVLESHPDHAEALHALGVLYLQGRQPEQAVASLRKAVAAAGANTTMRNNLAVALCVAGRFEEAAALYREMLRAEPDSVPVLLNLGKVLNVLTVHGEALPVLRRALDLSPDDARVHHQLALALAGCGSHEEALSHFERAVVLAPEQAEFHADLAALLLKRDRPREAAEHYRHALQRLPDSPAWLCGMGEAFGALDRHVEAISCFERAVALAPDFAAAHHNLGTARTYLGRIAEARSAFARAVEIAPDVSAYRRAMIGIEKVTADNPHLAALEAMAAAGADPNEDIAVQFALAKAYDDIGDHHRAFQAMQKANAARRKRSRYDVRVDLERFRAIAAVFSAEFLSARAGQGAASEVPVFIVGMPRSGTSLVEQIIASHPAVFGAGEQAILPGLINAGRAGPAFPRGVAALVPEQLRAFGLAYLQQLSALAPQATRITDKLPLNFQLLGLIRLALPQARIIHVLRDPLDTCLSCFSGMFEDDLDFTLDLADLGRYYRGYAMLMEHWRAVLLSDHLMEIRYEDLVADMERGARRLVAHCGLDWDDRCLRFHETQRPVHTASAIQVRQPLYATSVGRAAHYSAWLEPLRQALAETPD